MKFAKTLQMAAETLPEEYKGQVLNYKKFKKSINKIVSNLESTGVYEIPENEKCKVIYSLSNKDGEEGEIKSSLILYIDKDYVAELSQKDVLELNSEEITIDPKLQEVIELSDDTHVHEKVTKERVLRSFQIANSVKNEFIFNKQLPLRRLNRRSNSDSEDNKEPSSAVEATRRNTVFDESTHKGSGNQLKRSKSDGDKMASVAAKQKEPLVEEEKSKTELKEVPSNNEEATSSNSQNQVSSSSSNDDNTNNTNIDNEKDNDIKDNIPEIDQSKDVVALVEEPVNEEEEEKDENKKIIVDGVEVDDIIDCTQEEEEDVLSDEAAAANTMKSLKVLLEADAQFLNELAASLSQLSSFQEEYKKIFETKINIMANILSEVSSPNMKDTYRWRELLALYCDSMIWKYRGKDRAPDEVIEQLKLFEIKAAKIGKKFKTKKSQTLLKEFIQLNHDIVAIKRFYELNQTAVYKILKKHDKRTHLLASEGFPKFACDETFFKDNIVRSLVYQISSRLLTVIPNPEEYFCPICREISYKPIRLDCGHLFCLRCLMKAKRLNVRDCPICRKKDVIYNANRNNLDDKLMIKLKKEFPREVKIKMIDSRNEKAREESENLLQMYGYSSGSNPYATNSHQCSIM
ncbi:hypothetical protein BCR36DRAFT_24993 [Piromyces finnis]|uniref:RING-type domain-containing protein n=1 Tax=Piromyces finnis TaxID=1754191 RepID=A0A1Y1VD79_9FUNG|nr:hypothetical protein BCR36DRAFT_24993 [Piromyces finnis]|eukprot:ORX53358.1 hypothetical protein BCR36DRAFT_24993 [Piromyces finnis]